MNMIKYKTIMIQEYENGDRGHKVLMGLLDSIRLYCGN